MGNAGPSTLKSDRLWGPREAGCLLWGLWVAVGGSRRLFHNRTPKFRLQGRERADGSAGAAVGKGSRSCWTLGSHVLWPHTGVRLLMRKFRGA